MKNPTYVNQRFLIECLNTSVSYWNDVNSEFQMEVEKIKRSPNDSKSMPHSLVKPNQTKNP